MTRSILILLAVGAFLFVVAGSGCSVGGVGDPCVPEQEYQQCFAGFGIGEVNVESKSFQCQTRLCLVNHFQGRVSCPYGQNAGSAPLADCNTNGSSGITGGPPYTAVPGTGSKFNACSIPGGSTVLGTSSSLESAFAIQVPVEPQILARNTAQAVYCSCRCEDANGGTTNGVFCSCPSGYTCTQLVQSIGTIDNGLAGGYCIKTGTDFQASQGAEGAETCNSDSNPCP